jgi:hypothetical protein
VIARQRLARDRLIVACDPEASDFWADRAATPDETAS